jgi:methylenetetrahydrofolate dehydrogenase (NADP+)/methenyltetrahydrofolate cyclohydrolase
MTAKIIDGKSIAAKLRSKLRSQIHSQLKKRKPAPKLAVILVGDDPASAVYVRNKHLACEEVGIQTLDYSLPAKVSQKKLIELIRKLNKDKTVSGILLQLPLPKQLKADELLEEIDPLKDVDGFHSSNLGRLAQGQPQLKPCTPRGVMLLLKAIKQRLLGKQAVIVGASNIVGKPMALELLAEGCTVTICHRFTQNLAEQVGKADILVSAVGKPGIIKGKWIKKGATVIDVGIILLPNGKLTGDVEFEQAMKKAKWITPVPGGVGPMTVAVLLENTVVAQRAQLKKV